MRRAAAILLLSMAAAGCGYHLVGTVSSLPPDARTLHVATFVDRSGWAELSQRLTEAVTGEWVRRRRFVIVEDRSQADLELRGTVVHVGVTPVTVDEQGRATEYQMTLTLAVQLYDLRGGKPRLLWEDRAFSRRTSYTVDVNAVNYFDRQLEALDLLSGEIARNLVTAVLEGF